MHDLVIRNAILVDGTGAPKRVSDVSVDGKIISEVAPKLGAGKREINADGLLLTFGVIGVRHDLSDKVSPSFPSLTVYRGPPTPLLRAPPAAAHYPARE